MRVLSLIRVGIHRVFNWFYYRFDTRRLCDYSRVEIETKRPHLDSCNCLICVEEGMPKIQIKLNLSHRKGLFDGQSASQVNDLRCFCTGD